MLELNLHGIWHLITTIEDEGWTFALRVGKADKSELKKSLGDLLDLCEMVGLATSVDVLRKRLNDLPQTDRELQMTLDVVKGDLAAELFVHVPRDRARYFERDASWLPSFPTAALDLREAGNAYAASLDTAVVYHCMRALEFGLYALAVDTQAVTSRPLDTMNWGEIIDQTTKAIETYRKSKGVTSADPKVVFWSDAAADFFIFKEAWRNRTNHVRATYTQEQARRVLDGVDHFMERLAEGGLKE